ncbi:hypothetical protein [Arthrobacter sp.]|uniref:hypothetical protein n=1 Tax=Arthrobacter sp. TaxID=1667 RepID=UPI002589A140|nr:hypothetical protein [Arthrobacter sp.]
MTSRMTVLTRALTAGALGALLLGTVSGCVQRPGIEQVDVPSWQATALPSAPGAVLGGSGKLLDRQPADSFLAHLEAGKYTFTMTCEGNGKTYFTLSVAGKEAADATSACNGNKDVVTVSLPAGDLSVKASTVDAPIIYAFQLVPKG